MSSSDISRAEEKRRQMCLVGPLHQWEIRNHPAQGRFTAQKILQLTKPSTCSNWDIQSLSPPRHSPPPQTLPLGSLPINKTFHYWVMKIKIRQVSHPPWYYFALSSASSSSSTQLQPWRLKKIYQCGSPSGQNYLHPCEEQGKTSCILICMELRTTLLLHRIAQILNQEFLCTSKGTPNAEHCWRNPTGAIAPTLHKWEWRMVFQPDFFFFWWLTVYLGYFVKLHEDYKNRKIQEEIRFVLSLCKICLH